MHSTNSITESKPYSVTPFPIYQSLHLLRKRDKNSTENFVQGAKKAVKILDMFAGLRDRFKSGAAPYVLTGLLTLGSLIPGFNTEAKAETPTDGTQVAMNTKAAPQRALIPRSNKGHFRTSDLTKETSRTILDNMPFALSNDRIAIALHGENDAIEGAVQYAGRAFSKNVHDVSLMVTKDEDSDPDSLILGVYADGRHTANISIPVPTGLEGAALIDFQKKVSLAVYDAMISAYREQILPHLEPETPPSQDLAQN